MASASTVAASALSLNVTDPRPWLEEVDQDRFNQILGQHNPQPVEIIHSEPKAIQESRELLQAKQSAESADEDSLDSIRGTDSKIW